MYVSHPVKSIQPILKSNSTSFMFDNIFCEMKGKKLSTRRGAWGEWRSRPNFVFKVQFQYLLGYPSILLRYTSNNHTVMPYIGSLCVCSFYSFIFLCYNRSPEEWRFPALKSLRLPEFWTNKDGTRFILKRNEVIIENYQ